MMAAIFFKMQTKTNPLIIHSRQNSMDDLFLRGIFRFETQTDYRHRAIINSQALGPAEAGSIS